MERSKYYHNFSGVLNFTGDEMQIAVDEIIKLTSEYYIKTHLTPGVSFREKNNIDFKTVTKQKPFEYMKFGINLINGGLFPDLLSVLMQNAYEVIIHHCDEKEIEILRLQLLFVKKAIKLLHRCDYKNYFNLCCQLASSEMDLDIIRYKQSFKIT